MGEGKIISISGIDASGKSTVSEYIQKCLDNKNIPYIVTKQPAAILKNWNVFKQFINNQCEELDYATFGGLVSWGRLNTQIKEVIPALKQGKIVLCERYIIDIFAWSLFRGANKNWIENWTAVLIPEDCAFYCASKGEVVYNRLKDRNGYDKVGEDSLENVSKIIEYYEDIARQRQAIFIDTNSEFSDCTSSIEKSINEILS